MTSLSEKLRQKKQANEKSPARTGGLKASNLAIPAVDAGIKSLNRSSIVNEKLLEIDPLQCRPWKLHNRHTRWLEKERLAGLVESMGRDGQLQPGLVRKTQDEQYPYEIIFGVRRWSACKALGKKFRARITNEDDKACIRLMHFENEESRNISPLEKAFAYKDQLDQGIYKTQAEFAEDLNMTVRNLSRLLRIASLREYEELVDLLFRFVDQLTLRGVEEIASIVAKEEEVDLLERINTVSRRLDHGEVLGMQALIKSLRPTLNSNPSASETHVYLKQGRKSLIQVTRGKSDLRIVLKQGIEESEDVERILQRILSDAREGVI
jgi:ParB family chromosome partitioning protein